MGAVMPIAMVVLEHMQSEEPVVEHRGSIRLIDVDLE